MAVYACDADSPARVFEAVGRHCDHVHVDLIDETMTPSPSPIRLDYLKEIKRLWPGCPVALHLMSKRPAGWIEQTWESVDWYLLDIASEDDLLKLILRCRERGKKVGVVWRSGIEAADLMVLLPHVDFVMVLGIPEPGRSGQTLRTEALSAARTFTEMSGRYQYEVMFDGGVRTTNVSRIPAKYIVSASGVLESDDPIYSSFVLRSGGAFRRRSSAEPTTAS